MYSMLSRRDVAQSLDLGPEQFFQDTGSPSGVPQEIAGRIISAVLEVISTCRSLSSLLPRVLSHNKVESIPNIDLYLATSNDLERFIRSMPQYFTISGSHSRRESVVIGLDCEGVNLGERGGCLTLVQISTWDGKAFLFDAFKNPQLLKGNSSLKKILEHNSILKVIHDCKCDTHALHNEFGVILKNVFDTSIAMTTLMEQLNRYRTYRIGFKALLELLGEGAPHRDDDAIKRKMRHTPDIWKSRPLTEEMIYYAASDALCLVPSLYLKLSSMMTPIWQDYFKWACKKTVNNILKYRQQISYHGINAVDREIRLNE
eukprot:XP_003728008.2 PREDICTED: exonuclease 3'-5' domain-containing protein 1-like [Strongylocentrotus purpuratus]